MKDHNLKEIWKDVSGSFQTNGKWDVSINRKRTSDKISKTLRGGMIFDIIMKFIIATAAFLLLMYSEFNREYILFTVISIVFLLSMIVSVILSKKKLEAITPDLPVIESLEKKLDFMNSTYRAYMLLSALTAPMFVFTMNCYYFHYTYGEMRFNDPVILGFLLLAFLIGYFAQLPIYNILIKEVKTCINDLDEEKFKELETIKGKHRKIMLVLIAIGVLFLAIGLLLFYLL